MKPNIVMSVTAFVLLMQLTLSSYSQAAPTSIASKSTAGKESAPSQITDEEQQLETLKNQEKIHENVAVVKSEVQASSNVNGQKTSVMEKETKVQDTSNGQMLAHTKQETVETQKEGDAKPDKIVKTVVDIPNKGIHRTNINHNGKEVGESKELNEDYYIPLEGIQYSPIDMAEYIYRTGDEDGVTLAIEELMRERMLSQEDAINYLEEVKMNLDILRAQDEKTNRVRAMSARREMLSNQESREQKFRDRSSQFEVNQHLQQPDSIEISSAENKRMTSAISLHQPNYHRKGMFNEEDVYEANANPEIDYEEMLGRVRIADFLSKEFSLEEVIYQLAKQMFTQSVIRGNSDAEEALQRFTLFLQEETARGRISPVLQRRVINALLAALMDTVGEHPEFAALQSGPVISSELKTQTLNDNSKSPKTFSTLNSKRTGLKKKSENESQLTQEKSFDIKAETSSPTKKSTKKNASA